jgi:hypothetical protein
MRKPPVVGKLCRLEIDAGREPRQIGGAERGGFLDHRAVDRRVREIGEALHGPERAGRNERSELRHESDLSRRTIRSRLCSSSRHSGSPASRSPSSTLCILLLNAAVPIVGPKLFKVVFGHSLR